MKMGAFIPELRANCVLVISTLGRTNKVTPPPWYKGGGGVDGPPWGFRYVTMERFHMTSRRPYWCTKNNETAAILVYQANPVGVEVLSYVNTSFCSNRFT